MNFYSVFDYRINKNKKKEPIKIITEIIDPTPNFFILEKKIKEVVNKIIAITIEIPAMGFLPSFPFHL